LEAAEEDKRAMKASLGSIRSAKKSFRAKRLPQMREKDVKASLDLSLLDTSGRGAGPKSAKARNQLAKRQEKSGNTKKQTAKRQRRT
jgi:hypothetical protein